MLCLSNALLLEVMYRCVFTYPARSLFMQILEKAAQIARASDCAPIVSNDTIRDNCVSMLG